MLKRYVSMPHSWASRMVGNFLDPAQKTVALMVWTSIGSAHKFPAEVEEVVTETLVTVVDDDDQVTGRVDHPVGTTLSVYARAHPTK